MDRDVYEKWKEYAAAFDMPTATLLREVLELAQEPMGDVADAAKALRSGEMDVDAFLSRMLLGLIKEIRSDK